MFILSLFSADKNEIYTAGFYGKLSSHYFWLKSANMTDFFMITAGISAHIFMHTGLPTTPHEKINKKPDCI
jgi:hypothetical protein